MTAPRAKRRLADMPPDQQAGILCQSANFQAFAATRCGIQGELFSPDGCAEFIRRHCNIDSRRRLTTDQAALTRFQALLTEYGAFTGRIPSQR